MTDIELFVHFVDRVNTRYQSETHVTRAWRLYQQYYPNYAQYLRDEIERNVRASAFYTSIKDELKFAAWLDDTVTRGVVHIFERLGAGITSPPELPAVPPIKKIALVIFYFFKQWKLKIFTHFTDYHWDAAHYLRTSHP